MERLIAAFPEQLRHAAALAEGTSLRPEFEGQIRQVLTAGMGGSGIGAEFTSALLSAQLKVPMLTAKDYRLPAWIGPETLVIGSSYSGNTEETLAGLSQAVQAGCEIAAVSSGGQVLADAQAKDWPVLEVPGGDPPRTCLGYNLVGQWALLHAYGLVEDAPAATIRKMADMLEEKGKAIREEARAMAEALQGSIPVFYGDCSWEPVLKRWCQQVNENTKGLAHYAVFPELNHNEMVGWEFKQEDLAVVLFRSSLDSERTTSRIEISRDLLKPQSRTLLEFELQGEDYAEQLFFALHFGDWLSYEWAMLKGVDPVAIRVIDLLKSELAKIG